MTSIPAGFLYRRDYWAVALTHFFVDVLNSSRNLLVAILAVNIGLTNAQVGVALLLYNVGSSLSQPVFGWLADRAGPRWLVIGGMGWMICFFALAAVTGDWPALIALTVAGLGSGAFHPTGTMVAGRVSFEYRSRATAVFFTAGQLGLFVGPIVTGLLLEGLGRPGYLALPALALVALASGWQWVTNRPLPPATAPNPAGATARRGAADEAPAPGTSVLLALIILCTGTTGIAAISFAPKLFTELGLAPGYVGWLAGLFMAGSALGNVTGGYLGDRLPGKWVIALGALLAVAPVYLYVPASGAWRLAWLLAAGFGNGMPHSILVLRVQSLFPQQQGMASGLALGFMFFSGSVGSYLLGLIADQIGLAAALQGTALLPLTAAAAAMLLPRLVRAATPRSTAVDGL